MMQTLWIYFSLKMTYIINNVLYRLHHFPIIKKLLAGTSYETKGLKVVATVLAIVVEVIQAFWAKALYLAIVLGVVGIGGLIPGVSKSYEIANVFLQLILFWSVIGTFLNNPLFECDEESYYTINLLRMDAKRYALINYGYFLAKQVIGLTFFGILIGLFMQIPIRSMLLVPFYIVGIKIFHQAVSLMLGFYKKTNGFVSISVILICFFAPCVLAGFGVVIPIFVSNCIMIGGIVLGLVFASKVINYKDYTICYKNALYEYKNALTKDKLSLEVQASRAALEDETSDIVSSKKGLAYMNDLFVKRHRKILWGATIKQTIGILILLVLVVIPVIAFEPFAVSINTNLMHGVPFLVFVMYMLNRGMSYTQALFVNCDHSLLTYSFYKEPKSILRLFRIRLFDIVKVNLLPAAVLGAGMSILLYVSGGTAQSIDYAILFVSVVCLSIFFSVHYLMLYYLLQPFDVESKIKSTAYSVAKMVTYLVCYNITHLEITNLTFGIGTILFCILYSVIACILVYKKAPKTFRIRKT